MTAFKDFTSHSYREFNNLVIQSTIIVVAVGLRFLCKLSRTEHPFGWDDFWIFVALLFNFSGNGVGLWGLFASHGGTATVVLLQNGDRKGAEAYLLASDIGSMTWFFSIACLCFSVICFYLRIFRFEDRFELKARIMLGFAGAWGLSSGLASYLNCIPPSNFWKMKDLDKCGNFNVFILCSAILEIIITAGILVLPIKPVMKMTLSLRARLSVLGIFLLGAFVLVTGILRAALVYQPGEVTPNYYVLQFWSGVHGTAAFVSACLPMYQPLWAKVSTASKAVVSYSQALAVQRLLRSGRSRSTLRSGNSFGKTSSERKDDVEAMVGKDRGAEMVQEYEMWREEHRG